jgi:hypothetical protein
VRIEKTLKVPCDVEHRNAIVPSSAYSYYPVVRLSDLVIELVPKVRYYVTDRVRPCATSMTEAIESPRPGPCARAEDTSADQKVTRVYPLG